MCSTPLNSNLNILKCIIDVIIEIDSYYNKVLQNFLSPEYTKNKNSLKESINDLIYIINNNRDSDENNYQETIQKNLNHIIANYHTYNKRKLEISNFFNKIRESNEKLVDLINNIIPDFNPLNVSKLNFTLPSIINGDIIKNENVSDYCPISGFNSYLDEENNSPKSKDKEKYSQSIENDYSCTICHENIAIKLCDRCNQLFCETCEKNEKSEEKKTIKCNHDLEEIVSIKESNKIRMVLFLNSLNNYFKRILLKSNYLLKLNEDSENNNSKYIKKTLFEYPNMNIKDDLTEKKYFKCINDILEKTLGIKIFDINNFNISKIDQRLVNLFKNISMEDKKDQINTMSTFDEDVDLDEDEDDFENSIEDETFVKTQIKH